MVHVHVALHDADAARARRVAGALAAWFDSPFWGAATRRPLDVVARPAGTGVAWDAPHGLVLLAEALRRPGVGATSDPSASGEPASLVDRAARSIGTPLLDAADLADVRPLIVHGAGGPRRIVPGVAGLLALLLLRRLDGRVGESVLRALAPAGRPPLVPVVPWPADAAVPAHLLLPTAEGARLRMRFGAEGGPLLVPPATFTAVVGHLAGAAVEVRAGRVGLLQWLTGGAARWDPERVLVRRPLAAYRLALAGLRRPFLPVASVLSMLPRRPATRHVRWPLQLLSGALPVVPALALVDAPARELVRGG